MSKVYASHVRPLTSMASLISVLVDLSWMIFASAPF